MGVIGFDWCTRASAACRGCQEASLNTWQNHNCKRAVSTSRLIKRLRPPGTSLQDREGRRKQAGCRFAPLGSVTIVSQRIADLVSRPDGDQGGEIKAGLRM